MSAVELQENREAVDKALSSLKNAKTGLTGILKLYKERGMPRPSELYTVLGNLETALDESSSALNNIEILLSSEKTPKE